MERSSLKLIHTTVESENTARELAEGLVENDFAACVQVGAAMESFYRWDGELQAEEELPLVIKTPADRLAPTIRWITEHHPYDTPEILVTNVEASNPDYEEWARDQTRER